MDGDESGLNSYYHHHNHNQHHHHNHSATANSGTNGLFSNPHHHSHHPHHFTTTNTTTTSSTEPTPPLIFPQQQHSVVTGRAPIASSTPPPPPPPPETVRRKRGRPRKYGTSESLPQSATASTSSAKNNKLSNTSTTTTSSVAAALPQNPSSPRKKDPSSASSPTSSKKSQLIALGQLEDIVLQWYNLLINGNAGQGFTPHVITVAAGEDVAQKIMSFTQQRKRAVCILSASGSISNASLRQPATLGGNVTYEGRFEILSLSGSFLHSEIGGSSSRTGGLSVCLSGTDGRIVGGGVGGPLKAAGPVQVIAGSFVFDAKNEVNADLKIETSASKLPQGIIGTSLSGIGFRSTPDSSGRNSVRNDDHQHIVGSSFMLQPRGMHLMPSRQNDWRSGLDGRSSSTNIELAGTTDLESCQSPEDGDDEHLQD